MQTGIGSSVSADPHGDDGGDETWCEGGFVASERHLYGPIFRGRDSRFLA
jgi:hypothetical protein